MTKTGRALGQLGIIALLAAVLAFSIPVFVDSHQFTQAVGDYAKNPTAENATILTDESSKKNRIALTMHLEISGVLFVLLSAGWLWRQHRNTLNS